MFQTRKFYTILFAVGALYVLLVQQFFKNEGRFLFHTPAFSEEIPYSFDTDFQELNLPINKDINLHGLWFKHQNAKALVLLFPDSDVDFRDMEIEKNLYFNSGFDVLITAYRGTALSSGKPKTENELYSDAQYWYGFAKSQFQEQQIVIAGQGIGCPVAAQLASKHQPRALILENPDYSYSQSAKKRFWYLPYAYFTAFPLDTWKFVKKLSCALILIQNEEEKGKAKTINNYLKGNDKIYWKDKSSVLPYSNQTENRDMFKSIFDSLGFLE